MKTGFRYNRQGKASQRPACGFFRWLSFRVGALALLLRKGSLSGRLVWTEDASADALAAGFPSLLAVPEPLFAETAALFRDAGWREVTRIKDFFDRSRFIFYMK